MGAAGAAAAEALAGNPNVRLAGELEAGGHDTHDVVGLAEEAQLPIELRFAGEMRAPVPVADDGHRAAALDVLLAGEHAAV